MFQPQQLGLVSADSIQKLNPSQLQIIIRVCTYVYIYICTYTYTYHIHIHIITYTYTHTYKSLQVCFKLYIIYVGLLWIIYG